MLEPSDACDTNDDDDETANKSVKDDENGASGRTKITPNTNESDSESLAKIKLDNINHEDDTSTIISTISDDISSVRGLRTMNINEWLTDERAQGVIEKVHVLLNKETDRHVRQEGLRRICDTISTAQEGLDLAFAAGTLSTTACTAREDSAKYRE